MGVEVVCFVIVEVVCLQLREKIVCFVLIRSRLRVVERKRCVTSNLLKLSLYFCMGLRVSERKCYMTRNSPKVH